MNQKVAVVLLIKDKKILALKRSESAKSFSGYWNFPGGGVEKKETVEEAAVRELFEEANINIKIDDLILFDINSLEKLTIYYFITDKFNGEIKINNESTDYKWIDFNNIKDMKFIPIPKQTLKDLKFYIEVLDE